MGADDRSDGDREPSRREQAVRQLKLFGLALLAVLVGGLIAGWLFAMGSPERAASSLVSDFVVDEPNVGAQPPAADDPAPTSGAHDGTPVCGWSQAPVSVDDQLAALATGAVIVQYDPSAELDLETVRGLAGRDDVLVAPNPRLDDPVVATAWTRRMVLPRATGELLSAFVTGFRGTGPEAAAGCPARARQ